MIQVDKVAHASVSALMVITIALVLQWWAAVAITICAGVDKELYDKYTGRGQADWRDLVADAIGIVIGVLIVIAYRV